MGFTYSPTKEEVRAQLWLNQRLSHLALLTIESDILGTVVNDEIINQFSISGSHRILI